MNIDPSSAAAQSSAPRSLRAFQARFCDDAACAEHLAKIRWPDGFACPKCAGREAWRMARRTPLTFCCKACGKEASVTAGTIMHRTHLPLTVWFWAAYLMATHSSGMSALQLQSELGLGSYKTAWLLAMKLRAAMIAPGRAPLNGLVEVDETEIPFRTKDDPPGGGQGRSHRGKMLVVVAAEVISKGKAKLALGRIRAAPIADFKRATLHGFIAKNVEPGAVVKTDGLPAYDAPPGVRHDKHVVGSVAAHVVMLAVHRVISNLKTWALGVYHGLRRKHLARYLDEYVFRFNRRKSRPAAFTTILALSAARQPAPYHQLITPCSTG